MKVVFPMAGLWTRFKKVADTNPEYLKPKPFINVEWSPMITWASRSLPLIEKWYNNFRWPEDMIFIVLKEHNDKYALEKWLKEIYGSSIKVIIVPNVTRWAAETAYYAKEFVNPDEEVIISDSDHYFIWDSFIDSILNREKETIWIIPVFVPPNDGIPKRSYSLPSWTNHITKQVWEKDIHLMNAWAYANIGVYYFSKAQIFFDEANEIIQKNILFWDAGKWEFYIAPIYQRLIEKWFQIEYSLLPEVWGLWTPEDLKIFLDR